MSTLLIINAAVMGIPGILFIAAGANAQSRMFGLLWLLTALANIAYLINLIK